MAAVGNEPWLPRCMSGGNDDLRAHRPDGNQGAQHGGEDPYGVTGCDVT